jgi:transposase
MLGIGAATRVYVAIGATDMRKGFEGLFGIVRDRLLIDPLSGHLFVFCNPRKNRRKILFWDGSGIWICSKTNAPQCPQRLLVGSLSLSPMLWADS